MFGIRRRQLLAYGKLAYRDHHGRQDEFSFPFSLLFSYLFSLAFSLSRGIFFYPNFDPLFFSLGVNRSLSFSLFLSLSLPHTRVRSLIPRTRNTLSLLFWSFLSPIVLFFAFFCNLPHPVAV